MYVESGTAMVETVFGALAARQGDYVLLPRATTHRWIPTGGEPLRLYAIEANSHIAPPKRYLSRYGQLLEHAPYCERDLHGPGEPLLVDGTDVEVLVKHRGGPAGIAGTRYVCPTHPFDVVGWDGCLYPYTFNVADFEPITGRVHQPPPVHQVFEGEQLRRLQLRAPQGRLPPAVDPGAVLPLERRLRRGDVLLRRRLRGAQGLRASGRARSRLHPGGHSHGPQPGAYERSIGVEYFDELAVMVDTFRPLELGEGGRAADDRVYAWTWSGRGPGRVIDLPGTPCSASRTCPTACSPSTAASGGSASRSATTCWPRAPLPPRPAPRSRTCSPARCSTRCSPADVRPGSRFAPGSPTG